MYLSDCIKENKRARPEMVGKEICCCVGTVEMETLGKLHRVYPIHVVITVPRELLQGQLDDAHFRKPDKETIQIFKHLGQPIKGADILGICLEVCVIEFQCALQAFL